MKHVLKQMQYKFAVIYETLSSEIQKTMEGNHTEKTHNLCIVHSLSFNVEAN